MALTHTAVTNAKPTDKVYKMFDGGGLYLIVKPTGFKSWKYDYRIGDIRGTYTIGKYPDFKLKDAREEHQKARECVARGINPKTIKDAQRIEQDQNNKRFSYYAYEWLERQHLADSTYKDLKQRIEKNLIPYIDRKNVNEFSTLDLLNILRKISDRGAIETAQRMANVTRRIFNDILALGLIENNPAQDLSEILPKPDPRKKTNFGHITSPEEIKVLLQQIDNPNARQDPATTQALKLMPLIFLRPKNIRFLKWEYIDFDKNLITLPASELKTGKELQVPLSIQAVKILRDIQPLTGEKEYVFISSYGKGKPISENTTTKALGRLINPSTGEPFGTGYMTSHGFRHMASTQLNELGYDADVIELQLAHINKDRVRAIYNKSQLMDKRITMMQDWADYLDQLKNGETNV